MTHMEQNMALVEAFGKLEQLCNQIYGGKHGVTDYIDDMTNRIGPHSPHWGAVLRRLKELRHKRNKLSHGEVSFQTSYATEQDVQFLLAFYQLILRRDDPIAQLHKAQAAPKHAAVPRAKPTPPMRKEKGGNGCLIAVAVTVTLGILVTLVLIGFLAGLA